MPESPQPESPGPEAVCGWSPGRAVDLAVVILSPPPGGAGAGAARLAATLDALVPEIPASGPPAAAAPPSGPPVEICAGLVLLEWQADAAEAALERPAGWPRLRLRRRWAGPAAARNAGIEAALAAWPACRALLFLEAGDRPPPGFLARLREALASTPSPAWLQAGEAWAIARAPLQAGLRFDAALAERDGLWAARLRLAEAGLPVAELPPPWPLRSRALPSTAASPQLAAPLRLRLEAAERPRFLLSLAGAEGALRHQRVTDPLRPLHAPESPASLLALLRSAACPPVWVFGAAAALESLAQGRLLHHLVWRAGMLLEAEPKLEYLLLELAFRPLAAGRCQLGLGQLSGRPDPAAAALIFARSAPLLARLRRPGADVEAGLWPVPGPAGGKPRRLWLRAELPGAEPEPPIPPALAALRASLEPLAAALAPAPLAAPLAAPDPVIVPRPGPLAAPSGPGGVLPLLPPPGQPGQAPPRRIALLVPATVLEAQPVALRAQAEALRRQGWLPHLVLPGGDRVSLPPALLAAFDTLHPLPTRQVAEAGLLARLLAPMQAALDLGIGLAPAGLAALRQQGLVLLADLRPAEAGLAACPEAALLAEGYDGLLLASPALAERLVGLGLARDRLFLQPVIAAAGPREAPEEGPARHAEEALRVLLVCPEPAEAAAMAWLARALLRSPPPGLRLRLRLRGPAEPAGPLPPGAEWLPPEEPEGRAASWAWADAVLLAVPEAAVPPLAAAARSHGCVVLAPDSALAALVIDDGRDGLLLPEEGGTILGPALAGLRRLAGDAAWRDALLAAARRRGEEREGERAMADWIGLLARGPFPPGEAAALAAGIPA